MRQGVSLAEVIGFDYKNAYQGELAFRYLEALLQGDRIRAGEIIMKAVEAESVGVKDIYLHVFQPILHEIGRLWQQNLVNVAEEHLCTAATQLIMSRLYPRIFSSVRNGFNMVAACVGGELHEIGIRMVSDFFEMDGWDTFYLGANTPEADIMEMLRSKKAHILGISATMAFHVQKTNELIGKVRSYREFDQIKIMVGGYPFKISPDLWRILGADGTAGNAAEAIVWANRIVGRHE